MPLIMCLIILPLLFVTLQSRELATTEVGRGCGLECAAIDPLVALEDDRNEKPGPWVGDMEIGSRPENGRERAEGGAFQHHSGGRGIYGGFSAGRHYGGVNGVSAGRWFGARRPRQSDTATLFDSLDENADGVLAEDEIREFVEEVGGSTLDDHSEISGGVSTVMERLDTDSVEGIGLKELSSRIKSFESILTVEEAVDWVTHAVQLPQEVAEAFRSNSVSGYDLLEFLDYDGRGLHYDLGIKRSYRKRIVQAIEIRVLGLGEEPQPPKLHQPTYLGTGKARITWSTMDENALADSHENVAICDDHFVSDEDAQASEATCISGTMVVRDSADIIELAQGGRGRGDSFHTFPVHKYVLQRSCLGCQVTGPVGEGQGGGFGECSSSDGSWVTVHEANVVEMPSSEMEFVDSGLAHGKIYAYRGFGRRHCPELLEGKVMVFLGTRETICGIVLFREGVGQYNNCPSSRPPPGWCVLSKLDWEEVLQTHFFLCACFVLAVNGYITSLIESFPRIKAWNRVGHSEASFVRLTTPPKPHLWKKPWRIIVPWLSTVNSSTAPGPSPDEEHHPDDFGIDIQGIIWACVVKGMGAVWFVMSWSWWLLRHSLSAVNTFVVLAGISANLMRLAAAYGEGGTGSRSRRNWPAVFLLKLTDLLTRNRFVCNLTEEINVRLESLLGNPSAPPTRGITRQHSMRSRTGSSQRSHDVSEASLGRDWSPRSDLGRQDPREDWMTMSRIDEEYAGVGVDFGWRPKEAYRARRWSSSMEYSANNHKDDFSGYHTVSPSFTWKTDLSPTGQRLRWPRRVGARTPQRRVSGRPEGRSPPRFFGQGGDGSSISMESRREIISEQLTSSAESSLPIRTPRHAEHSEERSVGVSRRRMLFRRGISLGSSMRVSRKEAGRSERGPHEGKGRVGGRDVCDDRVEGDLGEPSTPPGLLRSGSSESRLTMHLRKSSVSRLALGLRKGEASGRDAWRKEFQEAQACFICHRRFHSLTVPRHQCGRCHRAFCRRDGYTTHPPLTRCSIPGTCVCDVCLQSETPGDRRGTVGDNTEGLGMGTLETETQEIGDTTAPSDGVSDSSGRRLSWKNSGRWPSFGRHSRRQVSTRNRASTESSDPLSSLAVSSVMDSAAAAAAASSVREYSTGTTSPSEESPATLPPHASQRVSINEARVGIRGGVIGVREPEIRRQVTR